MYGRPAKVFRHVQRSASKVPAWDNILNALSATTIGVNMVRKPATFRQMVQADKHCKPQTAPFQKGIRVLVRGPPYTCSRGQSKKLDPRWFGPLKDLQHLPDTDNYKLHLTPRMARHKPYFHVSSLKEYSENDPNRFKSGKIGKPAPLLMNNPEEWEADHKLDYRRQYNRHEFLLYSKAFEQADGSWKPITNLDHSLDLIQEDSDANHVAEPTPKLTSHYIKTSWNPWKFPPHPVPEAIAQTTCWNPMRMRHMIRASLSRTVSPQITTASYWTPTRGLKTARTEE